MATYCTTPDVRAALTPGGLDDDDQTAASLADWQINDAIDEAEGLINAYLQDYTITPITLEVPDEDDPNNIGVWLVAPDPVRYWTRDVAAYLAALTFRKSVDLAEDDPIRLRFTMVMGLLADVRAGKSTLPLPTNEDSGHQVEIFNLYEGTLFGPEDFNLGPDQQNVQVLIPRYAWGSW